MNCPVCEGTRMREVEKNGILIDICPSCKGVWLDRGELDKLMQGVQEVRQDYNQWYYGDDDDDDDDDRHKRRYPQQQQPYPPQQQQYQSPQQPYPPQQQPYPPQQRQPHYDDKHAQYPHKKKKKSVMDVFGDLFGGD
ncbi:zf-TFIIB domain-containing protein [Cohnella yongneupensis]|uniref:Zf-TFIIB domain-containing protein n=1 Tax=Cohnella yongneupensis TaxID=425006 RepID=A0ABW0QZP5_9BACL